MAPLRRQPGVVEIEPADLGADAERRLRGIEFPLAWGNSTLQPGFTIEDGLVTKGVWTGTEGVMRDDVVHRNSTIIAGGWNSQFKPNERLTLDLDLGYSRIKKTEENLEIYLGTGRGAGVGAREPALGVEPHERAFRDLLQQ